MAGKVFVVLGSRKPFLARTRPYYRDPWLRWLVPSAKGGDPLDSFRRPVVDLSTVDRPRPQQPQAGAVEGSAA